MNDANNGYTVTATCNNFSGGETLTWTRPDARWATDGAEELFYERRDAMTVTVSGPDGVILSLSREASK